MTLTSLTIVFRLRNTRFLGPCKFSPCAGSWWNKKSGRVEKCDWVLQPGQPCPKNHPERPVALLAMRVVPDEDIPWGTVPFFGLPGAVDQASSGAIDEGHTADEEFPAAPVAFRAVPVPNDDAEPSAVTWFDSFLVLFCAVAFWQFFQPLQ